MDVILEERRKEWQKAVKAYEKAVETGLISEEEKKIKGQLNPYEIYKEDSLADYYYKLMEENLDFEDKELAELLDKDMEEIIDGLDVMESEEFEDDEADVMYDNEGFRIDKNGNRLEYWQSLDIAYKKQTKWKRDRRRKAKRDATRKTK